MSYTKANQTNDEKLDTQQKSRECSSSFFYVPYQESFEQSGITNDQITEEQLCAIEDERNKVVAIWTALKKSDARTMQQILENGFNVNDSDSEGLTLLHIASAEGRKEIVELLLMYKAEINAQDLYGYTPLMLAASKGHIKVVQTLLDNGADVNKSMYVTREDGNMHEITAAHLALANGYTNIFSLLVESNN